MLNNYPSTSKAGKAATTPSQPRSPQHGKTQSKWQLQSRIMSISTKLYLSSILVHQPSLPIPWTRSAESFPTQRYIHRARNGLRRRSSGMPMSAAIIGSGIAIFVEWQLTTSTKSGLPKARMQNQTTKGKGRHQSCIFVRCGSGCHRLQRKLHETRTKRLG
jgi:hypothetical protein